jgi:undecaprenyl-diphosphatase
MADRWILSPNRRGHGLQLAIATVVLLISTLPINSARVGDVESDVFYAINGLPGFLAPVLETIMQAGNFLFVPLAAALALAFRRFRLSVDLILAGTTAWLLAKVVKNIFVRGRPADLLNDVVLRGTPGTGHGYVSGHTAVAAALAAVIAPYLPRKLQWAVWIVAIIVGFSRMYVGAHLPLDVLGGGAMGWAIGSLVHFLLGPPDRETVRKRGGDMSDVAADE